MGDSTDARPETEGEGDELPVTVTTELLKKIHQLPENIQWLIADYVDALNERREGRMAELDARLAEVEATADRIARKLDDYLRARSLVAHVEGEAIERLQPE